MARTLALIAVGIFAGIGRPAEAQNSKLDDGVNAQSGRLQPVFVRMQLQLFRRGGDYESFAQAKAHRSRQELRTEVIAKLRANADSSWQEIEPTVQQLEADGALEGLQRYWVVNGFACRASGPACAALAERDGVEFVYLQKGNARQDRIARPELAPARVAQMRGIYKQVLADDTGDTQQPFTAEGLEIPWNVSRVKADAAWQDGAWGQGVVVSLMDSGLMVTPSLSAALWKNPDESLNGEDDDGNGLVDDLFGYDFDADSFYALGDGPQMTHGSMCGGIVAGRPNNSLKLATGIAPRARLMVLRGMGQFRAYEYAIEEGADVVSMSYMFTQQNFGHYRGVYRLAHEHMAAAGIVAVGGAGNFGAGGRPSLPEGKQIATPKDIPCVIAAVGVLEDGTMPGFSSRGPCSWSGVKFYDDYPSAAPLEKPDVCACIGGFPVWGRPNVLPRTWTLVSTEGPQIGLVTGPQGNSFAGPHAAGVAALVLSVNPDLTPWKVQQLMRETCQDMGDPGWDPVYGAGMLDAAAAVRAARAAD